MQETTFWGRPPKGKVYLAGPMRGIPHFNFPAFHAGARELRIQGYEVFSPAENDIKQAGHDISKDRADGDETKVEGFSLRKALGQDLAWICAEADAIAMLPGWEKSRGSIAEHATAVALGLKIIYL